MEKYILLAQEKLGYKDLKGFQTESLKACLKGKDVFVSQQTGMGKSLIYELFPLARDEQLKDEGFLTSKSTFFSCVLIISPLIALMQDQVSSLTKKGLSAVYLEKDSFKDVKDGKYTYIFTSPETILQRGRNILCDGVGRKQLQAVFIDECHCIAKW